MNTTHPFTTTAFELAGFRVVKNFGVVRGIVVRSRSVVGNFGREYPELFWREYHHLHRVVRTDAG